MRDLTHILQEHSQFAKIIRSSKPFKKLDFSSENEAFTRRDLSETRLFSKYIFDELLLHSEFIGIGGYGENRVIYRTRKHFAQNQESPRSIHLGTDIWAEAGEPIYAPLDGKVHSFAFNDHYGDYGPTIILRHEMQGVTFFTLYGHLSLESLKDLHEGKSIASGDHIATIGTYPENGDWPPHLHFQVIKEMGTNLGDFPGVSSIEDRKYYLSLCPDPNLILRIAENES